MPYLLNALYLAALALLSPWLVYKAFTTGKYRRGLWVKFTGRVPRTDPGRPVVWFHGVSVGEIHLLRKVVATFRDRFPHYQVVVSATTDTGLGEAKKHFADLRCVYWPLDFTWAVGAALRRVRPCLVVLAESELWPNFLTAARRRGVKIAVINGRMSPRSFARHRKLGALSRWLLRRVDLFAVQTPEYAGRMQALGAEAQPTGNVKYDGVRTSRQNPQTVAMRKLLGLAADDLIWVAGSTQAPEEEFALAAYCRLKARHPRLRLVLVPRQRERFAEVADLLARRGVPFVRRSALTDIVRDPGAVVLVDTIGELAAVWGLADVAFVGGSLDGRRGGQNMIEAAAYGTAVLFGPHVWNFERDARLLLEHQAAVQVATADELEAQVARLLADEPARRELGARAQQLVLSQQGAVARTIDLLAGLLPSTAADRAA